MPATQAKTRVLIAGGGYAGLFAAARLSHRKDLDVTLIDAHQHFVERIRLHEFLAGSTPKTTSYREIFRDSSIAFMQARIEALRPDQNALILKDGGGGEGERGSGIRIVNYDYLLYELGSRTVRLSSIKGLTEYTVSLDAGPQLEEAQNRLKSLPPGSPIIILGAGLTGLETATELKERYPELEISMLCRERAFSRFAAGAQKEIRSVLARLGVTLREGVKVVGLDKQSVHLEGKDRLPCALAINCLGFELNALPSEAAVRTSATG